jgi:hypothetical protein
LFPGIDLLDYTAAVQRALADTHPAEMERIWLDLDKDIVGIKHEGMFIDYRRARFDVPPESIFSALQRFTQAVSPAPLHIGLVHSFRLDFLSTDTLRLKVAQQIPGEAWLEWKVTPGVGGTLLEQTIFFAPKGLPGFLSWYLLAPFHRQILDKLIHTLYQAAQT